MPILIEKHAAQNRRDGTRYPFPDIFDEDGQQDDRFPLVLVVETGKTVHGAMVFETKGLEMMLIGCSPRVTIMAAQERNGILYTLRKMGFGWIRCLVTKSIVKQVKGAMKETGFRRDDTKFASFFREI